MYLVIVIVKYSLTEESHLTRPCPSTPIPNSWTSLCPNSPSFLPLHHHHKLFGARYHSPLSGLLILFPNWYCIHSWLPPLHIHTVQRLMLQNVIKLPPASALWSLSIAFRITAIPPNVTIEAPVHWPLLTSPVSFQSMRTFALPAVLMLAAFSSHACAMPSPYAEPMHIRSLYLEPFPPLFSSYAYFPSHHSSVGSPWSLFLWPSWLDQPWITVVPPSLRFCFPQVLLHAVNLHLKIWLGKFQKETIYKFQMGWLFRLFLCPFDEYGGQGAMFGSAPSVLPVPRAVLDTQ